MTVSDRKILGLEKIFATLPIAEYKRRIDERRRAMLDKLAAQAQEHGMGYE